jgi:hypothetical protein
MITVRSTVLSIYFTVGAAYCGKFLDFSDLKFKIVEIKTLNWDIVNNWDLKDLQVCWDLGFKTAKNFLTVKNLLTLQNFLTVNNFLTVETWFL